MLRLYTHGIESGVIRGRSLCVDEIMQVAAARLVEEWF
jgi:hypothetical protein